VLNRSLLADADIHDRRQALASHPSRKPVTD